MGKEIYNMILEHLVVTESKEVLKKKKNPTMMGYIEKAQKPTFSLTKARTICRINFLWEDLGGNVFLVFFNLQRQSPFLGELPPS